MAHLLLIRPEAQSRRLLAALAAQGLHPPAVISPVIEILHLDVTVPAGADVVLTSQNAVAALPPGRRRAWCVGDRTAAAARAAGHDAVSAGGDVATLLARLVAAAPGPLVHLRGRHTTGDLAARARAAGLAITEVVAYEQQARPLGDTAAALLAGTDEVVVPLYSPRSAALLSAHAGPWRAPLAAVAISAEAAAAFARPARVTLAAAPTGEAMERAVAAALGHADGSPLVDRGDAG